MKWNKSRTKTKKKLECAKEQLRTILSGNSNFKNASDIELLSLEIALKAIQKAQNILEKSNKFKK